MNHTDAYAHTLYTTAQEKSEQEFDTFFDNFIALLTKKNHHMLLPGILKKVETLEESNKASNKTVLVVSNTKRLEEYKKNLALSGVFDGEVTVQEDLNIVGGYIAKNKTTMIDNSYRTRLLKMYRALVA